ncbi:hypothetical protein B0T25DRAFT_445633 [Lasiosphaeria hispida]|uniref:RRM domain-containing protein n=1 Tax=Lasiosphaeria hispida TaxID=260671 RepID=A0AAJ0HVZ1_9PEZI|nr:hypothetical protein B0T25DRAFT_445633 [Lasiosphaeria hispida]
MPRSLAAARQRSWEDKSAYRNSVRQERHRPLTTDDCQIVSTNRGFRLRRCDFLPDRNGDVDVDPQSVYPKSACVFVANLPYAALDLEIEAAVTRVFEQFGTVFVKIRRERVNGNLPYAFAQYINVEDARSALLRGNGVTILGRKCRTEMARNHTFYVVYRRDQGNVTVDEVEKMLSPYGTTRCRMLEDQVRDELNISSAVKVEFDVFDPTRNINRVSLQHILSSCSSWCIRRYPQFHIDAVNFRKSRVPVQNPEAEHIDQYDQCRRSLYVTDLPAGFVDEDIIECFGCFGKVHNIKTAQTSRGKSSPRQ